MDLELERLFSKLGLTEGEIKVYIALLRLGSSTVGPIIDRAKISSSKVYVILDKLLDKGLVSYILKERTKYFQAAPPVALKELVEKKAKEIETVGKDLDKNIEKIERLQKQKLPSEGARIYRGYKALKAAWHEAASSIETNGEYLFFSVGYGEDAYLKRFFNKLSTEMKRKKIEIKGIANNSEKKLYNQFYKKLGYQMKYTDIKFPADTTVAGDFVLIFVWDKKEPVVYSLKSHVLAESYKMFFKSL